jgi:hypothetical protein
MKTIKIAQDYYEDRYRHGGDEGPDVGASSPASIRVYLYNVDTEEEVEAMVSVDFEIQNDEYEGGFLFYQGGIYINSATLEESITIGGQIYPVGTSMENLIQYWGEEGATMKNFEEWAMSVLADQGAQVGTSKYPMTR